MPTSIELLNQVAERFIERDAAGQPMEPVATLAPEVSLEEAYQLQRLVVAKLVEQGDKVVGKKGGMTAAAAQASMGLSEPVYGYLLRSQQVADGGVIPLKGLIQPLVECEIAFRLGQDLSGPGVTVDDVLAATEAVMASFEIPDFRSQTLKPGMAEVLGYNVFARNFVLGAKSRPVDGLDLANLTVSLKKNGQEVATGSSQAVLGNPAASVAWLVNKAAEHGFGLQTGEIILAGTLTPPQPVQAGDRFEAIFEALGRVSVRFE